MRFVNYEKIFLSQNESNIWNNFEQILNGIERGTENQDIRELVQEIQSMLWDLWEEVEDVE